jgi:hypothetical protein
MDGKGRKIVPVLRSGSFRVLYIHVPKTGGTYVEELLKSYGDIHGIKYGRDPLPQGFRCTPQHFHGKLLECLYSKDVWEPVSYFDYVFMTVRHPVERLISEYKYQNRTFIHENWSEKRSFWDKHLNEWCRHGLEWVRDDPFFMDNHFRPQHEFEAFSPEIFYVENGYEPIQQRLDELLGMRGALPESPINTSTLPTDNVSLDKETIELVHQFYAEDFSRYGYAIS